MKYHLFLMRKYLLSRAIAWAAVLAVALGCAVIMICLTVMEGFKVQLRDRIRGTLSHVRVVGHSNYTRTNYGLYREKELLDAVEKIPHVKAAAPYVETVALYRSPRVGLATCNVRGIDPIREARLGDFGDFLLRDHEYRELLLSRGNEITDHVPFSEDEIREMFSLERRQRYAKAAGLSGFELQHPPQPVVVGLPLARSGAMDLGNVLTLSSYSGVHLTPETQKFIVVGVFRSGWSEHESSTVYIPLRAAQKFLDLFDDRDHVFDFRFSGISIELDDYENASEVMASFAELAPTLPCPDLATSSWESYRQNLLRAVETEKSIIYALMMFIVLFACVVIMVILWLLVIEKTRDLGVLASIGAPPGGIIRVFTYLGAFLSVTGATIGGLGGWAFTANINEIHDMIYGMTGWRLFDPNVYYLTSLPVVYTTRDMLIIFVPTVLFGLLGSFIPALIASRKDPVKTLRHE